MNGPCQRFNGKGGPSLPPQLTSSSTRLGLRPASCGHLWSWTQMTCGSSTAAPRFRFRSLCLVDGFWKSTGACLWKLESPSLRPMRPDSIGCAVSCLLWPIACSLNRWLCRLLGHGLRYLMGEGPHPHPDLPGPLCPWASITQVKRPADRPWRPSSSCGAGSDLRWPSMRTGCSPHIPGFGHADQEPRPGGVPPFSC